MIDSIPGQQGRVSYGVLLPAKENADGFDYIAGVTVESAEGPPAGLSLFAIPLLRYAVFPHAGHVTKLKDTMSDVWDEWLPRSGMLPAGEPGGELPGMLDQYAEGSIRGRGSAASKCGYRWGRRRSRRG